MPAGAIAGEVVEQGERLREMAADAFQRWESELGDGLAVMQSRGLLRPGD
ncbi:MAG: hypothetical protein H0T14_05895 [Nocardioidaceae bacterium]|nr:hypothetical protein [Nocardioidaceae bacterium]